MAYGIDCYIWDVKKGSAAYIKAADRDVAIDMGSNNSFDPLEHINRRHGVSQLDYLIASHLHYDHISDISNLEEFNAKPRILSRNSAATDLLRQRLNEADPDEDEPLIEAGNYYLELLKRYVVTPSEDPSSPEWADRATFTNYCLPTDSLEGDLYDQLNNSSIVTAVEREGFKLVTAGDMMESGLEDLMKNPDAVKLVENANVLIAPHHGRKSGFYGEFVAAVDPDVVVFSDKGGQAVDHGAQSQYDYYTTGVDVFNETSGEWERDKSILTTREDGRIRIQANTGSSWRIRKRPVSTADRKAMRA